MPFRVEGQGGSFKFIKLHFPQQERESPDSPCFDSGIQSFMQSSGRIQMGDSYLHVTAPGSADPRPVRILAW